MGEGPVSHYHLAGTQNNGEYHLCLSTMQLRVDQPVQLREHLNIHPAAVCHMQAESF